MKIIAFGDIHQDAGAFHTIAGIGAAEMIVVTGDITNYGNRQAAGPIMDAICSVNPGVLALPGNLDKHDVAAYLAELGISLHGSGRIIGDTGIFGVGGSNRTPFNTPMEFSEEELASLLAAGYEQVREAARLILVSHAPPVGTRTDMLRNGAHVGSSAVRAFIEEKQPLLCLCGHIHEARAMDRIGNTLVLNPGMIRDGCWIEVALNPDGSMTAGLQPASAAGESGA